MNMTTIQSVENNPLKFSPNIDDVLEKMFILHNKAYKNWECLKLFLIKDSETVTGRRR